LSKTLINFLEDIMSNDELQELQEVLEASGYLTWVADGERIGKTIVAQNMGGMVHVNNANANYYIDATDPNDPNRHNLVQTITTASVGGSWVNPGTYDPNGGYVTYPPYPPSTGGPVVYPPTVGTAVPLGGGSTIGGGTITIGPYTIPSTIPDQGQDEDGNKVVRAPKPSVEHILVEIAKVLRDGGDILEIRDIFERHKLKLVDHDGEVIFDPKRDAKLEEKNF
jgi:hypothetical protein